MGRTWRSHTRWRGEDEESRGRGGGEKRFVVEEEEKVVMAVAVVVSGLVGGEGAACSEFLTLSHAGRSQ